MMAKSTFTSLRARIRIERILTLLATERLTVIQLAKRLHGNQSGINNYVRLLCAEKKIHIAGWDESGYRATAQFAIGDLPDAPKPKKSKVQYWKEVKADPIKLAKVHATQERVRIKRRGREYLLRECKQYDPPIEQQIEAFVKAWPGSSSRLIAEKLDVPRGTVKYVLTGLSDKGAITFKRRTKEGKLWEAAGRQAHAPMVTRPQGIFAALGL